MKINTADKLKLTAWCVFFVCACMFVGDEFQHPGSFSASHFNILGDD